MLGPRHPGEGAQRAAVLGAVRAPGIPARASTCSRCARSSARSRARSSSTSTATTGRSTCCRRCGAPARSRIPTSRSTSPRSGRGRAGWPARSPTACTSTRSTRCGTSRRSCVPRCSRARAAPGVRADAVSLVCPVMTIIGESEEELVRARDETRLRIAFYGSTRTYAGVFDLHGWEGTSDRLHELQRAGDLKGMAATITDEMLEVYSLETTWDGLADALHDKYDGIADRVVMYDATGGWEYGAGTLDRWRAVTDALPRARVAARRSVEQRLEERDGLEILDRRGRAAHATTADLDGLPATPHRRGRRRRVPRVGDEEPVLRPGIVERQLDAGSTRGDRCRRGSSRARGRAGPASASSCRARTRRRASPSARHTIPQSKNPAVVPSMNRLPRCGSPWMSVGGPSASSAATSAGPRDRQVGEAAEVGGHLVAERVARLLDEGRAAPERDAVAVAHPREVTAVLETVRSPVADVQRARVLRRPPRSCRRRRRRAWLGNRHPDASRSSSSIT